MHGGAWWATVHGVAKSLIQLNDFTFTFFWCKEAVFFPFSLFFLPFFFSVLFTPPFPSVSFLCYHFLPFSHYPPSCFYTLELVCPEEAPEGPLI